MSKTFTDLNRHALNGPTMGTRWSALFHAPQHLDVAPVKAALQAAVEEVDTQMSTWKPDSDLMRLNAAPRDTWIPVPAKLFDVLQTGLVIGRESHGAFDIGMGDAVTAWGFGSAEADPIRIRAALEMKRHPAHETLELNPAACQVRKHASLALDLSGIAKGYGVDCLADTLTDFGIHDALVGIDGELRALGLQPDGSPWAVAVEEPDMQIRTPYSILTLQDAAVATSGDYRHWIEVGGRHLSHTMDPRRGGPLQEAPASVTVVARTCTEADAWATALMVLGMESGPRLAEERGLSALFLRRARDEIVPLGVGPLFLDQAPMSVNSFTTSSRATPM
ncbi:FAD:protein FMN transferase [Roseibium aggregatum]|uniref:FAD:protein FMN transferase n=1 Tax=Roseibium aggregatum TaxID=187304 RepID=A0A926P0G5_9HYPH|nr:FAD:protein FMN transferase [Roseibium aggregatum]MBD1548849.1 FAD:protein FMN transferase [Roseibium aggregatum]